VRLCVTATETGDRLVAVVWKQIPGRPDILISRDEYRLAR
jgi:hypothetical protein